MLVRNTLFPLFIALFLGACAATAPQGPAPVELARIFNVVFEGAVEVDDGAAVLDEGKLIGKVIEVSQPRKELTLARVEIEPAFDDMIDSSSAFYVSEKSLYLISLDDEGKPVLEGARLLGFAGKTQLYWHKTRSAVSGAGQAAMEKAQSLYQQLTQ